MKNAVKWSTLALAVAAGNGLIASQAMAEGEGFVEGASATRATALFTSTAIFVTTLPARARQTRPLPASC